MISPQVIEEIRKQADIVEIISSYIDVKKKGNQFVAVCPFHADTNPSLSISRQLQIYKCFSCQAGGNVFTFVQEYERIPFIDAVRKVAEMIGYSSSELDKKERSVPSEVTNALNVVKQANELYQYLLKSNDGKQALDYLLERGISQEMIDYFELGYSSSNPELSIKLLRGKGIEIEQLEKVGILKRSQGLFTDIFTGRVTFPIYNEHSECIGFSSRRIINNDEAKYVNSPNNILFNKSNVLYNYQNAKKEAKREGYLYIVEGFMDVFALYQAGVKSCVAIMGTALTPSHAKMIKKLNVPVRLCLDGDEPGQHAMVRVGEILDVEGIEYQVVDYGKSTQDPDEILQKYGKDILKKLLNRVLDKYDFIYLYYKKKFDLSSSIGRRQFAETLIPQVSKIKDEISRDILINRLSLDTGITKDILNKECAKLVQKPEQKATFNTIQYTPIKKSKKSKLDNIQRATLMMMLSSNEAIKDYQANSNINFVDPLYLEIANYMIDILETQHEFDIGTLISVLQQSNNQRSQTLISTITELQSNEYSQPYSKVAMEDNLMALKREYDKNKNEFKFKNETYGKDYGEQAKILQDYVDSQKGDK
ncbi:MAG: DNA primase [Erysipelotrichaceae bacterium]|nr:DNA primase [Erysipelotrichaceae bacterium]